MFIAFVYQVNVRFRSLDYLPWLVDKYQLKMTDISFIYYGILPVYQNFFFGIQIIYHDQQTRYQVKITSVSFTYYGIFFTYQKRVIHLIKTIVVIFLIWSKKWITYPNFSKFIFEKKFSKPQNIDIIRKNISYSDHLQMEKWLSPNYRGKI